MENLSTSQITDLLQAWADGDDKASKKVWPVVYDELRKIARSFFRRRAADTLQPTALVHDAYLHLIEGNRVRWDNRAHFYGAAARTMRQILVDHYRHKSRLRRGGDRIPVELRDDLLPVLERAPDLVGLDDALSSLEALAPEQAAVVELRYFGGLTLEEVADYLGISRATAVRRWRRARAWLYDQLRRR